MTYSTTSYLGLKLPIPGTGQPFEVAVQNANLQAILDKLQAVEGLPSNADSGTWVPTFGGSGTALGAGGSTTGTWFRVGNQYRLFGKLAFGSSPSFGGGTPVISGLPINFTMPLMVGKGSMRRFSASDRSQQEYLFTPTAGGAQAIIQIPGAPPALAWAGLAPAQSDELVFVLEGTA